MEALIKDTIFRDMTISERGTKKCKKQHWFVTYFSTTWDNESDVEDALDTISGDLLKLKHFMIAIFQAEICPETGLLHFHIAVTYDVVGDYCPLAKLEALFDGAYIRAVNYRYVDVVREYCSKEYSRVGEVVVVGCELFGGSELREFKEKYEGKWTGEVVKVDKCQAALAREMKLKLGRKNDAEKLKAIKNMENIIQDNLGKMSRINGRRDKKLEWDALEKQVREFREEVARLKALKPGESMYGEEDEEEDMKWEEKKSVKIIRSRRRQTKEDREKAEEEQREKEYVNWHEYWKDKKEGEPRERYEWLVSEIKKIEDVNVDWVYGHAKYPIEEWLHGDYSHPEICFGTLNGLIEELKERFGEVHIRDPGLVGKICNICTKIPPDVFYDCPKWHNGLCKLENRIKCERRVSESVPR